MVDNQIKCRYIKHYECAESYHDKAGTGLMTLEHNVQIHLDRNKDLMLGDVKVIDIGPYFTVYLVVYKPIKQELLDENNQD